MTRIGFLGAQFFSGKAQPRRTLRPLVRPRLKTWPVLAPVASNAYHCRYTSPMTKIRLPAVLLALLLLAQLAACGNKGDLVKPDQKPADPPAEAAK